jgi:hypothetical protein
MLPVVSAAPVISAARQLHELQASVAPGASFSSRIAAVHATLDRLAGDHEQFICPMVIVSSPSLPRSAAGLSGYLPVVASVSGMEMQQRGGADAMSPEARLLFKLAVRKVKCIQRSAVKSGVSPGVLSPYIKDHGILTERGRAVIRSDAIIRWMQLTVAQRKALDMKVFFKCSGIPPESLLRFVGKSGGLMPLGGQTLRRAGHVLNPLTRELMMEWLRIRNPLPDRKSTLVDFCKKHALLPCILRRHFYRNGDLNRRGWRVLGMLRKDNGGSILDKHQEEWLKLTPDECNQLGYDGFAKRHQIDEFA